MPTKILIAAVFLYLIVVDSPLMAAVPVTLTIADKDNRHPLRLPVRLLQEDGSALVPEGADVPDIYLDADGAPRADAFIYVDGSMEFEAPSGALTVEVAGVFAYRFYKRSHPVGPGNTTITIELEPWPEDGRLLTTSLPIGDAALWTYASSLDGCLQAFQITIPSGYDPRTPMPLQFHLHGHGQGRNVAPFADRLEHAPRSPDAICVKPICRGDAHYQGMGQYEFFEIYHGLQKALAIDPDRVTVEGYSMGGAGTWHLAGRFPYLFSAAFPRSGYLDYTVFLWTARSMDEQGRLYRNGGGDRIVRQATGERLEYWRKIGDRIIEDWQVPLYERQGTIGVLENTLNLPMMIEHGAYDMSIFGGVDVENSRRAWQRFLEFGYPDKHFIEFPCEGLGHGGPLTTLDSATPLKDDRTRTPEQTATRERLRNTRRNPWPRRVVLRTNTLEYNRNAWVELDALNRHWRDTTIDVQTTASGEFQVEARNVRQFTLNLDRQLVGEARDVAVTVNQLFSNTYAIPEDRLLTLRFDDAAIGDERWKQPASRYSDSTSKRPGLQGPILHAFHGPHVYLASSDEAEETARIAADALKITNGGWLCSLMPCSQQYHPLIRRESDAKPWEQEGKNLVVFGTPETSSFLRSRIDRLPISYSPELVRFGVREIRGRKLEILMIHPDPEQSGRYLVWCTPGVPQGVFAQLWHLPDFVVVENGQIVFHGFFDEEWAPRND